MTGGSFIYDLGTSRYRLNDSTQQLLGVMINLYQPKRWFYWSIIHIKHLVEEILHHRYGSNDGMFNPSFPTGDSDFASIHSSMVSINVEIDFCSHLNWLVHSHVFVWTMTWFIFIHNDSHNWLVRNVSHLFIHNVENEPVFSPCFPTVVLRSSSRRPLRASEDFASGSSTPTRTALPRRRGGLAAGR